MAKDKLTDYSATNGSNTDVGGINIDEGMLPSAVNNSIRELMTHQKEAFGSGTPLYVDQTNNRVGVGNSAPSTALEVDADGAVALTVDRATSDGNVAEFQQDGTTLAQIGALGVRGYFAADNAGISPYQNVIYPTNGTGTAVDNTVDIGHSSYRPKDLYLGGNLYIGGTGSANSLSDYEEGTWTPAYSNAGGTDFSSISYHVQTARYVKVGRQVHTWFLIATNALTKGSASGSIVITGLPYTVENVDYQSGVIGYSQTWVSNHPISCLGTPNTTQLFLYHSNGSTSHVNTSVSNMSDHSGNNRHYVYGALSYRAA